MNKDTIKVLEELKIRLNGKCSSSLETCPCSIIMDLINESYPPCIYFDHNFPSNMPWNGRRDCSKFYFIHHRNCNQCPCNRKSNIDEILWHIDNLIEELKETYKKQTYAIP